jgi:two-component sensor histidine kinase
VLGRLEMRNGWPRDYLFGLLVFAGALVARVALDQLVPDRLPFITFFPAVFLAYYFGLGPGILVLVLSAVTGTVWVDPTGHSMVALYITSALLFLVVASIILVLTHLLRSSYARLKQQDEQLALINRELKHRIKNLFSITNSVCLQTIKAGGTVKQMSDSVSGRILAIASAQDLLSATATSGADLRELVTALVGTLAPKPSRLEVAGPPTTLPLQVTTPMALILHELATNALKYGAWFTDQGYLTVTWQVETKILHFRWREHDGPTIAPAMREGLGSGLIKQSLPGATVRHDLRADGLEREITLPLTVSDEI